MFHLHTEGSGGFTGQADNGVAVGTVIGDFKVHNGIVIADDQIDVVAYRAGLVIEDPNAVQNGIWIVVQGQTQLFQTTEHTIGNLAAELALGDMNAAGQVGVVQRNGNKVTLVDILRTGDDLNGGFLANIHLADPHMVGIFVADDGDDFADLDILNLAVHSFPGFHLLAEDGQLLYIFFIADVGQIHKFFVQPFSVKLHNLSLLRTDSGIEHRYRK